VAAADAALAGRGLLRAGAGAVPGLGYAGVWGRLTAALDGQAPCPSPKALRDLRRRLGAAPLRALFEVLAGPLGQPPTPGVRFGRYRTVAFDGCRSLKVPDTARTTHRHQGPVPGSG